MADHRSFLEAVLEAHADLLRRVGEELGDETVSAGELVAGAIRDGGKVLVCGNGGSAADSQHFAAELVGRFGREGDPLPALALTVDTSILTALGNDIAFSEVFARQVEALARPGDVLIVISTSGRSANVLRAAERARELDVDVIALTGADGLTERDLAGLTLAVPSHDTQRIQEMHSLLLHCIGEMAVDGAG